VTNTLIDSVFINGALGLAVTNDGAKVYTTASDWIPIIDTSTNDIVDTIAVDGAPSVIAVTPDLTRTYVGVLKVISRVEVKRTVTAFDTATKMVVAEIPVRCPGAIAIHDLPPRNRDACRDGAYRQFGALGFRNQGQCIKYVNEHAR
jgi:DNA-binding beta-propeller fold protein YncE